MPCGSSVPAGYFCSWPACAKKTFATGVGEWKAKQPARELDWCSKSWESSTACVRQRRWTNGLRSNHNCPSFKVRRISTVICLKTEKPEDLRALCC